MQHIDKILKLYSEEIYRNSIECYIEKKLNIHDWMPILLQDWDQINPLFSILINNHEQKENVQISVRFKEKPDISPNTPPSFNYLFFIKKKEQEKHYEFSFIECSTVTPLENLDIAYDDSTKINLNKTDDLRFEQELSDNYVFDYGVYKLLFVKRWEFGEENWCILGINSHKGTSCCLGVGLKKNEQNEDIRLITKRERYSFPSKLDEIEVLAYKEINFVDIGHAKEAHDNLLYLNKEGNTVIALWGEYSRIEKLKAFERSEELGEISYKFANGIKNGIANLSLDTNFEQTSFLSQPSSTDLWFNLVSDESNDLSLVKLIKFNPNTKTADFEDQKYCLKPNGKLKLSTIGDKLIQNRRKRAKEILYHPQNVVTSNLLFAIENKVSDMFETDHKRIPALSKKTENFLYEKFGIKKLTENQKEAVELALNNINDITIIQGPPGTGKTTVVAAICQRLFELADKKNKSDSQKTVLASAFQNDTIEHLASKLYTNGLPTIKIGRKKSEISIEEIFISEFDKNLTNEIKKRNGFSKPRFSSALNNLALIYAKEKKIENLKREMHKILPENCPIQGISFLKLDELERGMRNFIKKNESNLTLANQIPSTKESYNSTNTIELFAMLSLMDLTDEEKDLLDKTPEKDPNDELINKLSEFKLSLINRLHKQNDVAKEGFYNEVLLWLEDLVKVVLQYEETNYENEDDFICSILSDLKNELKFNSSYIKDSILQYSDAIAATNQVAGSKEVYNFQHINNVILEEAARSNPLDLIIPMVKANERIIMVGDQNQLPHLLEEDVAERSLANIEDKAEKEKKRKIYEQSLFGIIFNNLKKGKKIRAITLNEQFRMHPSIGEFISNTYYKDSETGEGILKAANEDLYKTKLHNLSIPWAKDKTMVFCHVPNSEYESKGRSKYRSSEVKRIMKILDELRKDPEFEKISIGVITFYSSQVMMLYEEASKPENGYVIKREDGYVISPKYEQFADKREKFRIGTVDSFQGKEFDIVILSTVRSNTISREDGNEKSVFGFLTLSNRLNVAFSRAQKLVIVVGDAEMFEDAFAKKYVPGLYEFCTNITKNKSYGNRI